MKKKYNSRIISMLLTISMVFSVLPINSITANASAEGILSNSDLVSDDIKLGRGFNLLGSKAFLKENVSTNSIFDNPSFLKPRSSGANHTEFYYTYINDISSYLKNQSSKLDVSVDASAKISIVSIDASVKYGLDTSSSSSGSENMEYISLSTVASRKKFYFDYISTDTKEDIWSTEGVLNDDFKKELLTLTTDEDIRDFFASYGTHIITSYIAGGEACYTYRGEKVESSENSSYDENVSVSADVSVGSFVDLKTNIDTANHFDSAGSSSETGVTAAAYQKGGIGLPFEDTDISTWEQTITDETMEILVNDSLKFMPIWELLVDESQADLKVRLKDYFEKHAGTGYSGTDSSMGTTDYSDYTFITNAEELHNIKNNLSGKYVLLCDIDLSNYSEWTPIGSSKDAPFCGILDGNGNEISGLNITKATNGAAGLFGYVNDSGKILNLSVKGAVNVDATGSENDVSYIGGIVGYNNGVLSNCRNYVDVRGVMQTIEDGGEAAKSDAWFADEELSYKINTYISDKLLYTRTVSDGGAITVDDTPIRLTGELNNITITVKASETGAFIILDDADISGLLTIESKQTNATPVYIVSIGEDTRNRWDGLEGNAAIDLPNAPLYIIAENELLIRAGKADATPEGQNGLTGHTAIYASDLNVDTASKVSVSVYGSDGGDGSRGTDAEDGADGTSYTGKGGVGHAGKSPSAEGGIGATGGLGGYATEITQTVNVYGNLLLFGGNGGNGGDGGDGGNGGKGGNSGYWDNRVGFQYWHIPNDGANGGPGSPGGQGGDGGKGQAAVLNTDMIRVFQSGQCIAIQGNHGNGGDGGNGGRGGNGGDSGDIHAFYAASSDWYWVGDESVYQQGGYGGQGGNGGNGGNGLVPGAAGLPGNGGLAGYKTANKATTSLTPVRSEGRDGAVGEAGSTGDVYTPSVKDYINLELLLSSKRYQVYRQTVTNDKLPTDKKLISISSDNEQDLLEEMLSYAMDGKYWIGLRRLSTSGANMNVFEWDDGNSFKFTPSNGSAVYVDDKNNSLAVDAYVNWLKNEPNNLDSNEQYVCVDTVGKWYDTSSKDSTIIGYITEETLASSSNNAKDKNTLAVGGICGFADVQSEITNCINYQDVIVDKASSESYGVSAYAGGIAGLNYGKIHYSVNLGNVKSIATSNSITQYADAYAAQIANTYDVGKVENCYAEQMPVSIAVSGCGLTTSKVAEDATTDSTILQQLEALWQNDDLRIKSVNADGTSYYIGEVFDKNSIVVEYNGNVITRFKVNYYFEEGKKAANVVISYEDSVRILPVKLNDLIPTELRFVEGRTEYYYNDTFNAEGLIVDLYYNTGASKSFSAESAEITFTKPDMTKLGTQTVTVSYIKDAVKKTCIYNITISPIEIKGSVHIDGTALYGETLTLNTSGVTTPNATYTIAWYKNDDTQPLSTAKTITVSESMIDQEIRVVITGIGNYQGSIVSDVIIPCRVETEAPTNLTLLEKTDTTVSLQAISGAEYKCENGEWQQSNVFTNLLPNTQYRFYARYAQTGTTNVSSASAPLLVTTDKTTIYGTVKIDGECSYGNTLTANVTGLKPSNATYTVSWHKANNNSLIEIGDNLAIDETLLGEPVKIIVTGTGNYTGSVESATVTPALNTVAAPEPPVVATKSDTTVTLVAIDGYEYSKDAINWQQSNEFTDLLPNTQYMFYQRVAQTATTYASPASKATIVTTDNVPIGEDAPQIIVKNQCCMAGKTVEVSIDIKNNPGIASATLKISFDTEVMTLVKVTDLGNLGAQAHKPELVNPYTLAWANDTLRENITYNGTIVKLTFKVAEDAELGNYPVTISYNYDNYDIYNVSAEKVLFATVDGTISIVDDMIGDVNGDGLVNNLDRMVLTRYLADWEEYPEESINIVAADVNGDNLVNNLDRMILTRHLANWEGYEILPYAG